MTQPVLFLDFDGVLNSSRFFSARIAAKESLRTADERVDPASVLLLNRIVEALDPMIVASTMWRHAYTVGALTRCLRGHGFTGRIRSATPLNGYAERGGEIQAWMTVHNVLARDVVILDDDDDMAHLYPRLVRTSARDGLTDRDVERVIKMIGVTAL